MRKCISKTRFNCIYLTKENREEFLKLAHPEYFKHKSIVLEDNEQFFILNHTRRTKYNDRYKEMILYNHWYVMGYDYSYGEMKWECYTEEEFNECFELCE